MTINLLLRTAEAPLIRRRGATLALLMGALAGCASPGSVWEGKDAPYRAAAKSADGVQQAQATEAAPDANAPALKPVPKQDPSAPSIWIARA